MEPEALMEHCYNKLKRGKKGKTEFDLSTTVGFQNEAYNKMNMLSGKQRLELLTEAVANSLNLSKDLAF